MIVTFTFVKALKSVDKDAFFERWTRHTLEFDVVDHPYITKNRLMMISGHDDYIGIAENHWPDIDSLIATDGFYKETDKGREHWADLRSFMDIDNSPTVIVDKEADVSDAGIQWITPPEKAS